MLSVKFAPKKAPHVKRKLLLKMVPMLCVQFLPKKAIMLCVKFSPEKPLPMYCIDNVVIEAMIWYDMWAQLVRMISNFNW